MKLIDKCVCGIARREFKPEVCVAGFMSWLIDGLKEIP